MIRGISAAAAIAAIAAAGEIFRELHTFVVTRRELTTDKMPVGAGLRIVFLSDLHCHEYGKDNQTLWEAVKKEKPDLILAGGDMLVAKPGRPWETAAAFMQRLTEIAPVWAANGNHEQRMHEDREKYGDAYDLYTEKLRQAGIRLLINESAALEKDGAVCVISGMEPPSDCYCRMGGRILQTEDITRRLGAPDPEKYQILLAHQPDFVRQYVRWGADLTLCGHHHGGIVRIPGLGAVLSPQMRLFPRYSGGIYREGKDVWAVVSRGLGTHTVNLRFCNPAEVIVLDIRGRI